MFWRKRSLLQVPPQFNRNSITVTSLMTPEQSGRWLLERMQRHVGLHSYSKLSLLDFGCGVRFSQAILNQRLPMGQYAGVDCFDDMIRFLQASVKDRRFSYHFLDVHHPLYNPSGSVRLGPETRLPFAERHFDLASMFSVITHQNPTDAASIMAMLRRYVSPSGHLFFSCFLDDTIESFEDRSPELNGGRCFYNPSFLDQVVRDSGWEVVARHPAEAPLIGDSYVCRPA